MKINHKSRSKKPIIIIATIIIVILTFTTWLTYHYQVWPFSPKDSQKNELNNDDKTNPTTKSQSNSKSDTDFTKNTSEIPISNDATVEITNLSQDNQTISLSANITNSTGGGICSATFTKKESMTVVVNDNARSDKCGPILIPASRFDSIGEWVLTLRYYSNDSQSIDTGVIEVK